MKRKNSLVAVLAAVILLSACAPNSPAVDADITSEEGSLQLPAVSSQEAESGGIPAMTEENQAYYDKYLYVWGFKSPFEQDFTEENYFTDFKLYFLFHESASLDGTMEEYQTKYGETGFPAEVVESTIQGHFLWSTEQIRGALGPKPQDDSMSEYYDKETNTYGFPGGYGGAGSVGVVTRAVKEGELLLLDCDWYSAVDSELDLSHTVTLRLEGDGFHYIANKVTHRREY